MQATMTKPEQRHEPGQPLKLGRQWRTYQLNRNDIDEEARTVPLSFSSEEPYERWWGVEILGHAPAEVDMTWISSGRAPLLADHDMRQQIGVVMEAQLGTDRKGRAVVKFGKSPRAEQEFQDVKDGVRTNVSVGYEIRELELVKREGDVSTYRVIDWMPLEVSLVSVPADMSVGVGRESGDDLKPVPIKGERALEAPTSAPSSPPSIPATPKEKQMTTENVDLDKIRQDAIKAEHERAKGIIALGTRHNMRQLAEEHIAMGTSLELFRGVMLDELHKKGSDKPLEALPHQIGMSQKEARQFSLRKFLLSLVDKNAEEAGFEHEVVGDVRKRMDAVGHRSQGKGYYLPLEVMSQPLPGVRVVDGHLMVGDRVIASQRDLATSSLAAGGALVSTDLMSADFITLLRNASLVRRMGARVLGGLVGNVDIPRQIGSVTPGWVAQGGAGSESDITFSKVTMTPKTVHAIQDLTREMLLQATPAIEGLVRADMVETMAAYLDWAALHAPGTGNAPTGLANIAGIGAVVGGTNGAAPTWDHIVELESQVANSNAAQGSVAYLTNTRVRGRLKRTQKFTGTSGQEVWQEAMAGDDPALFGRLNGYRAGVSNNVRSDLTKGTSSGVCSALFFGNWSDLLIGEWGGAEILVDEVTQASNRIVRTHIYQTIDIQARRAQSFAAMLDALHA